MIRQISLIVAYIACRAFGWCLLSFCLVWAIFFGFESLSQMLPYAGPGALLILISEIAFRKLMTR